MHPFGKPAVHRFDLFLYSFGNCNSVRAGLLLDHHEDHVFSVVETELSRIVGTPENSRDILDPDDSHRRVRDDRFCNFLDVLVFAGNTQSVVERTDLHVTAGDREVLGRDDRRDIAYRKT